MIIFKKGKLHVRTLKNEDKFLLAKWLSDPDVLQYYEERTTRLQWRKSSKNFSQKTMMKLLVS